MPLLSLSSLCVNVLLQNHLLLTDLGDVRYPLIKKVLLKLSFQQLSNLESKNPMLIFEDDEIWDALIRKEFPQELNENFTTNKSKIWKFYEYQLNEFNFDVSQIDINHYINIKNQIHNGNKIKYKLPSKLVYLKLLNDYQLKKEIAIENLRQRTIDNEKSKEKNKLILLNEIIPTTDNIYHRRINSSNNLPNRSKLFQKAHNEAKKHLNYFRNPMNNARIIKVNTPSNPIIIPSQVTKPIKSPQRPTSPAKPIKRNPKPVSIFLQKKPKKKEQSPSKISIESSTPSTSNTSSRNQSPSRSPDIIEIQPERKKIKLGEYLSRNK